MILVTTMTMMALVPTVSQLRPVSRSFSQHDIGDIDDDDGFDAHSQSASAGCVDHLGLLADPYRVLPARCWIWFDILEGPSPFGGFGDGPRAPGLAHRHLATQILLHLPGGTDDRQGDCVTY